MKWKLKYDRRLISPPPTKKGIVDCSEFEKYFLKRQVQHHPIKNPWNEATFIKIKDSKMAVHIVNNICKKFSFFYSF